MSQRWPDKETAKSKHWFSTRHQTREAHDKAQEHWRTRSARRPKQVWIDGQWVHGKR